MDTPERKIATPISKFEDSPVFNYINSLSPIQPVKSVHITQTFSSLSFSSPPSVFTSPHVSCHKESRFLKRHNLLDAPKPKVSSDNKVCSSEEAHTDLTHAYNNSCELPKTTDQGISIADAPTEPSTEQTKFATELPRTLKYDCGSPGYDRPPPGDETNSLLDLPGKSAAEVTYVQEACEKGSAESELHLQGICQLEPRSDGADCDWENLVSDATDVFIFNSPNETESFKGLMQKSLDPTAFCNLMSPSLQTSIDNGHKMRIVDLVASNAEHEIENHPSQPQPATETDQTQGHLAHVSVMASNSNENNELIAITHRGLLRRCLDFEMAGGRKKSSDESNTGSSNSQSDERKIASDKQLIPAKRSGNSLKCILPGIGLHLNALATLKDSKSIQRENLSSGRQPDLPSSSLQLSANHDHHPSLISASSERDLGTQENGVQSAEDCSQQSVYLVSEDFNQDSPKKKRRKLEPGGEGESCKRCNCKKSKCLKLYCECFAAGVYCIEPCSCQDCFNKPIHEDTVLATRKQIESRNPLAFAPKVIRSSDSVPEIGDDPNKTPASARHKRGCNCKKSSCLKKYCECYQGGVGCSINCRCEGCKNAYGRKDGSVPLGVEAELGEEAEASEKAVVENASQKTDIQNNEDCPDSGLPTTPLRICRPLVPFPFSSKGKPPRASFITTISASGLYSGQTLGKPNILRPQPKLDKRFQTIPDDEMPEVLQGNGSPTLKTSSPNGKRISSPNCEFGSSPSRRSGRKLILQSIPSFPSLTPHH